MGRVSRHVARAWAGKEQSLSSGALTIKWVRMTRMSHGAITKLSHHRATMSLQGSQMIR